MISTREQKARLYHTFRNLTLWARRVLDTNAFQKKQLHAWFAHFTIPKKNKGTLGI